MKAFKEWAPSSFDAKGLGPKQRQEWLVGPVTTNRDADCLARSNWEVVTGDLDKNHNPDHWEVHEFGHWACGWFRIVLVAPGTEAARCLEEWEHSLDNYPIADENHFSDLEVEEAHKVWGSCFTDRERLAYMRDHKSQFDCLSKHSGKPAIERWREVLDNVRGRFFSGYPGELIQ